MRPKRILFILHHEHTNCVTYIQASKIIIFVSFFTIFGARNERRKQKKIILKKSKYFQRSVSQLFLVPDTVAWIQKTLILGIFFLKSVNFNPRKFSGHPGWEPLLQRIRRHCKYFRGFIWFIFHIIVTSGKINGSKGVFSVERGNLTNFNSFAYGKCSILKEFPITFSSTTEQLRFQVSHKS